MWLLILLNVLIDPIITRHDISDEKHKIDPGQNKEVVALRLKDATGIVEMEGTFIRKNWIVTAAHGLSSVEANQRIKLFDEEFVLKRIIAHPDWDGSENDLALLELDKNVPNVDPVKLYNESNEVNKYITIIGRGWSGTGITGPVENDRVLRIATNRIDSASYHYLKFRFDAPDDENVTELEGVSGPGDSGGPAFIEKKGIRYLAGISSHQINLQIGLVEGMYGVIDCYTRVSTYIPWIEAVLSGKNQAEANFELNSENKWGFPETPIGHRATLIMNSISAKTINENLVKTNFDEQFQKSTDLVHFLTLVSQMLNTPQISEFKTVKKHILRFHILSEGKTYYMQIDAEKRNDYLIGGFTFKKLE